MSLTNLTTKTSYAGNGVTTVFPFTFKVFQAADLVVTETTAAGVTSTLVLNTDYTVAGVGLDAGGSITRRGATSPPPTGTTGLIRRVVALTQTADIRNQSAFYASVHEDVFDKLTMVDQQQEEEIGRSLQIPEEFSSGVSNQLPAPAASTVIGWNAAGTGLANFLIPGVTPAYVVTFNGRSGAVVPAANDYSFAQISGTAAVGQIPNLPASQITSGLLALARGGTNADLSATGGASRFLRQNTVGGPVTVVQPAFTDLSGAATTAQIATALTTPGPIGGTTASTISGTTITATTQFTGPGTGLTGTATSLTAGNATAVGGVTVTGTPSVGQVPTATSGTAATWQTPSTGMKVLYKTTASATVGNTTTETSLFGSGVGSLTIPANSLAVGSYLRLTLRGTCQTITSPGNQTIKVKIGGLTVCTATTTLASTTPGQYTEIVADLYVTAIGASGSVNGHGKWAKYDSSIGDTFEIVTPGTAQTVNTTGTLAVDCTMTWATANANNTMTIYTATLEQL
ncbi:MAG: hypothetical protein JSR79_00330 [Proteobacteria bacterium]|nr:hypothetical protein [Pseudomonadota bacterium]